MRNKLASYYSAKYPCFGSYFPFVPSEGGSPDSPEGNLHLPESSPRWNPNATQRHSGAESELKQDQRPKCLAYMGKYIKQKKLGTVTPSLIFPGVLLIRTCVCDVAPDPAILCSFLHAYVGSPVTINLSKGYFPQMSFKFIG